MKKRILLLLFCIAFGMTHAQTNGASENTQSQSGENFALHRVLMGETVVLLAKKYKMTPQDIYEYNPDASEGISQGMTLRIPLHRQVDLSTPKPQKETPAAYASNTNTDKPKAEKPAPAPQPKVTKVLPETVPAATAAPVTPETFTPIAETAPAPQPKATEAITHTVQPGETLYGLSQKYGVSISDIKQQNEDVKKRGLHVGQVLSIQHMPSPEGYTGHQVQQGETLYSLSRKYGVSVGQISDANKKALKNGLQAGQMLQIPTSQEMAGAAGQ